MNLTGILSGLNRSVTSNTPSQTQGVSEEYPAKNFSFSTGQTLSGKVLSFSNGQIALSVNGTVINGNLLSDLLVSDGQELTFTVKQGANGQILLSPLFENTAHSENITQALQAAGLPLSQENRHVVGHMMAAGLPISKEAIFSMLKNVDNLGMEKLDAAIGLSKLGMSVTNENAIQYENYESLNHALQSGMSDILKNMSEEYLNLVQNGKFQEANQLEKDVLSVFLKPGAENSLQENEQTSLLQDILSETELKELGQELAELNKSEEKLVNLNLSGQQSGEDVLKQILEEMDRAGLKKDHSSLIANKGFQKLVKNLVFENWLQRPEDIGKEGSVKELYKKLFDTTRELSKALETIEGQKQSNLSQSVQNVRSNLDFMNQINQFSTYVQLPLKLQGQEGNGELYVFTDKKSLAKKDGNVTALLHLSMDHLGDLDVFLALSNDQVKTKFYLQDESIIDYIAENIHLLDDRLEKRGYHMHAEVLPKEAMKEEGISDGLMHELLKKSKTVIGAGSPLKGFDVKA